jgi:hypothetical protein
MEITSEFIYGKNSQNNIITEVEIEVNGRTRPITKKEGLYFLSKEMNRFVANSAYAQFKPVAAISHAHIIGWNRGYTIRFYANLNEFETMKERKFVTEPSGKYTRKRNEFLIHN